jgi:hypothetical protein
MVRVAAGFFDQPSSKTNRVPIEKIVIFSNYIG